MTNQEYIVAKLEHVGVSVSANYLAAMAADGGITLAADYTPATAIAVKTCIAKAIPEMLMITNVSEGGYSVSRDVQALKAYYGLLCADLGLPNKFKPSIKDKSTQW